MKIIPVLLLSLLTGCAGVDPVTVHELRDHVTVLASDAAGGRMTGTEGIVRAEEYIYGSLLSASGRGILEIHEFSLFYPFLTGLENGFDTELGTIIRKESRTEIYFDIEHYPLPGSGFTQSEKASRDLVFAGYGITAPEYNWNDYEDLDVKDKIVLLFRHEPRETETGDFFEGRKHSGYATFVSKIRTAHENGAAGIILMDDPLHHRGIQARAPAVGFSITPNQNGHSGELPALHVSIPLIEHIFPSVDFNDLQRKLDSGVRVADLPPLPESRGILNLLPSDSPIIGRNIFLFIPSKNNNDGLSGEERFLIVGAHHDHIGKYMNSFPGDAVFNGADDNASGTSVLLELAEMFPLGLKNAGLIFITFSAEELGLFGARKFIEDYPSVKSKAIGMINFDMVGRNPDHPVVIQYDRESILSKAAASFPGRGFRLERFNRQSDAVSDSLMFSRAGIPTLFFFSGLQPQYHTTADETPLLNIDRMKMVADKGYEIILSIDKALSED